MISLAALPELSEITPTRIGSLVTLDDLGNHPVIQECRSVKLFAAVHNPMSNRQQAAGLEVDARLGHLLECDPQGLLVVGYPRRRLADMLNAAALERLTGIRVDEPEFQ